MRTRYCSFCQAVFSLIIAKYINYSPFGGLYWEKTVIEVSDTQDLGHSFSQYRLRLVNNVFVFFLTLNEMLV